MEDQISLKEFVDPFTGMDSYGYGYDFDDCFLYDGFRACYQSFVSQIRLLQFQSIMDN